MLIMDELMSWLDTSTQQAKAMEVPVTARTAQTVREAKRFVVEPPAVAVVKTLMRNKTTLKRAAPHLFFPAANTWIEWHDPTLHGRIAVHFMGWSGDEREEIHSGALTIHHNVGGKLQPLAALGEVVLDSLNSQMPFWIKPVSSTQGVLGRVLSQRGVSRYNIKTLMEGEEPSPFFDEIGTMTLGFLALLNSPRMVHLHHDSRLKLNKNRIAKGKYPLLAHEGVHINLAKHEYEAVVHDEDHASRPLHFVRAYLRVQRGELQLIWPHWRGDPALGIKLPSYEITHKEPRP